MCQGPSPSCSARCTLCARRGEGCLSWQERAGLGWAVHGFPLSTRGWGKVDAQLGLQALSSEGTGQTEGSEGTGARAEQQARGPRPSDEMPVGGRSGSGGRTGS